ncbi:MAG: CotH kinase family protein [Prevotella sp.]
MKQLNYLLFLLVCLVTSIPSFAQFTINGRSVIYDKVSDTYMVSIPENAFGTDYEASIALDATAGWSNLSIEGTDIADNYIFKQVEGNKIYKIHAQEGDKEINTQLTFTFLPLLVMEGTFGYDYAQGNISLLSPDAAEPTNSFAKVKWRGGSTNTADKHKRNYKIKTLNEKGKKQEISLLGMREDNNWILDAGQIDLFRLRNRIATEIWNDFATKPYYASKEPKAKSGVTGKVVEVILNNEYRGIYSLTEVMDRKELKLKKYDDKNQEFHGQLWKVSSWDKATFWDIDKDYDNTQETWHAFETKYPDIDDVNPTDYSPLYEAIDFVANSNDEAFKKEVGDYFDIPVLIDYQLFQETLKPVDNNGKNMYWGIYDVAKSKKLTLAIWDLDASVGQYWQCSTPLHPNYVLPNTDLGVKDGFNLYHRLSSLNVDNYNEKVASRYQELRKTYFSEENLISRYQGYYDMLVKSGAASREECKWSKDSDIGGYPLNFKSEIEYIKNWIINRLNYLDTNQFPISTNISEIHQKESLSPKTTYNMLGQKVGASYQGLKIKNGKKFYTTK